MTNNDRLILTVLKEKGVLTPTSIKRELGAKKYNDDISYDAVCQRLSELAEKHLIVQEGEIFDDALGHTDKLWRLASVVDDGVSFLDLVSQEEVLSDEAQ